MTCRKFRNLLTPWLDGELMPKQTAELQAWIDGCEKVRQCSDCRKLISDYRSFHSLFSSFPQSEFPAFLHHRIMDEIKRNEPLYHKKAVRVRWQTVPATLAILLSLYVGSLVGIRTFNTQTATPADSTELYSFGENGLANDYYTNGDVQ